MKIVNVLGDGVPQPAWRVLQRVPYERMGQVETLQSQVEALQETCGRLLEFLVESSLMTLDQAQQVVGNYDALEIFTEPDSPPKQEELGLARTPSQDLDDDIPF